MKPRKPRKRFIPVVLLGLAAILIPGGFYFLAKSGPARVTVNLDSPTPREATPEEVKRLATLRAKEEAYFNIVKIREPSEADLDLLELVIQGFTELVDFMPGKAWDNRDHIEGLRAELRERRGRFIFKESYALEQQAVELESRGELDAARFSYRRAHNLQLTINADYRDSSPYNPGRALILARKITFLEAEPSYRESIRLEQEALFAEQAENFQRARQLMQQAIQLQENLNSEHRDAPQANFGRLSKLKLHLINLQSAEMQSKVELLVQETDQFEKAGLFGEAVTAIKQAASQQRVLNDRFPDSRFASTERLIEMERKLQMLLSREQVARVLEERETVRALLRTRQVFAAADRIPGLLEEVREIQSVFPRARDQLEAVEFELTYLDLVKSRLEIVQDALYESLRPIPGDNEWWMLCHEVPQEWYVLLMGANESPHKGDDLPVYSVSRGNAQSFCQRLGWILGLDVDLPTELQFRAATEPVQTNQLAEIARSAEVSENRPWEIMSMEPNGSGFYDLIGNVAEWLESPPGDAIGLVGGGHFRDPRSALVPLPILRVELDQASDLVGFRVVVRRADQEEEQFAMQE